MSGPVTTYNSPKAWAWSYSKLKNYEVCPKRHHHVDILKDVVEPMSAQLEYGNALHNEFARTILAKGQLLSSYAEHQKWVDRVLTGEGNILVEQKYAIRADFSPCTYFDKQAWYRGIGDVVKLNGEVGLVIDWKTGKIVEDSVQLMLMAQCLFSHYPELQAVRAEFVWLKEDATTKQIFKRADMPAHWAGLMPRVAQLEAAAKNNDYPAKPGYLCKRWCSVTKCPHHGE